MEISEQLEVLLVLAFQLFGKKKSLVCCCVQETSWLLTFWDSLVSTFCLPVEGLELQAHAVSSRFKWSFDRGALRPMDLPSSWPDRFLRVVFVFTFPSIVLSYHTYAQ